ncbi:MBL fold metallo-hydrolase [Stenotrophomonas rhizophila]|uniref:Glyoxylase-like metal-dependent hydrolase (Beta-lactamase superfamily II) n=1 Tax=Stenotrophomonas rhizophila TaxID=216778 RepID=A0AAW5PNF9_9GAMM|nr:MBL fold metallo-hydrolase [Stenotrophomonas rhizophila]MCS4281182.1 glyoxylase-like metal-dependent hydrolase (beta-lactamase superfamily II) [Stenotrophomonas rhizophila]
MPTLSRTTLALSLALITGLTALTPATSHARPAANAPAQAAPLAVQPYHPGDDALFAVSSTLITGRHDAILVDAQFAATDAAQLVQRIRDSGKRLTTIYISHGDPDYYFGLATLQDAFPDARILATPATVAHINATQAAKLAYWGPQMGAGKPSRIVIPTPLDGDTLTLEGQPIKIIGLTGPTPDRTVLWIPDLRTVLGGIPIVAGEHVWMADTRSAQSHAHWLQTLATIKALNPTRVIPGHYAADAALDISAVDFTADYIRAFDAETARSKDATVLIAAMKKRYPNLAGESSLELGAKVAKGEMQWP